MNNVNNVNIATAIYAVVHELNKCPTYLNPYRKYLFMLSNTHKAKAAKNDFLYMLNLHDIEVLRHDTFHVYTKYGGMYTFASIRNNADSLCGQMFTNAYMDISAQDYHDYQNSIELIWMTVAYTKHRSDYTTYEKYKNNSTGFLHNCWSRSRWWLRKRWKNTMELFRGSKKVQRNNDW